MQKTLIISFFFLEILRGYGQGTVSSILPFKVPEKTIAHDSNGWKLVLEEEFDGDSLNGERWWPQETNQQDGIAFFTLRKKNVDVKDGMLQLCAHREPYNGKEFTSATVFLSQKVEPDVIIETAIRFPKGKGLWPAFWFWSGSDSTYQEIDVVELQGSKKVTFDISNHYWHKTEKKIKVQWNKFNPVLDNGEPIDITEGFHKYTMEWTKNYINIYMDNILIQKFTENVPQYPINLIFGLGLGGSDGKPSTKTRLPAKLLIDFVKIYKR